MKNFISAFGLTVSLFSIGCAPMPQGDVALDESTSSEIRAQAPAEPVEIAKSQESAESQESTVPLGYEFTCYCRIPSPYPFPPSEAEFKISFEASEVPADSNAYDYARKKCSENNDVKVNRTCSLM